MKRIPMVLFAAIAGLGAADASLAASADCLTEHRISGWTNLDAHSIVVREIGGKRFRVDLGGTCIGLKDAISLRVSSRGTGLCITDGDYVSYRYSGFGEQRCIITGVAPYEPAADSTDGANP